MFKWKNKSAYIHFILAQKNPCCPSCICISSFWGIHFQQGQHTHTHWINHSHCKPVLTSFVAHHLRTMTTRRGHEELFLTPEMLSWPQPPHNDVWANQRPRRSFPWQVLLHLTLAPDGQRCHDHTTLPCLRLLSDDADDDGRGRQSGEVPVNLVVRGMTGGASVAPGELCWAPPLPASPRANQMSDLCRNHSKQRGHIRLSLDARGGREGR